MENIKNLSTFNSIINNILLKSDNDQTLLIYNEKKITTSILKERVDYFTKNLIKAGINKGDCIGYTFENCPDTVYILLALSFIGATSVPLLHMVPTMGRISILLNSRAKIMITDSSQSKALKEAAKLMNSTIKIITVDHCENADENFTDDINNIDSENLINDSIEEQFPFMMASSSGTTGIPKPILFTQNNGAAALKASYEMAMPVVYENKNSYSCMLAFPFSSTGILVILGFLTAGVTCIFSDDMSPVKYLELIDKWNADSMAAPPAYFQTLLGLPMISNYNVNSINRVLSGMDFFSNKLISELKEKFSGIKRAANGYGLAETTNIVMTWKADNEDELRNSTNRLSLVDGIGNEIDIFNQEGTPCSIDEEGELRIKGNSVIKGYPGNDKENENTFNNEWFKTGDYAKKLGNNEILLLGRKKYIIKRGGRSVSPVVIKEAIDKIPGVADSAVIGVPHELYGEMIWAYVIKSANHKIKSGDIMRYCRENLASYMIPDNIQFIDKIPKSPGVGKVNIEKLKESALGFRQE